MQQTTTTVGPRLSESLKFDDCPGGGISSGASLAEDISTAKLT